jgi:hypothetical protein
LTQYQQKSQFRILIETGSYQGDMIEAQRTHFQQIYSIELSPKLYQAVSYRFRRFSHIHLRLGDSSVVLPEILSRVQEPAIFWLDAHYSGGVTAKGSQECPIFAELTAIFTHYSYPHVLLIDDARDFGTDPAYPSIAELKTFLLEHNPYYCLEVKDDIIRAEFYK